MNRVRIGWGAFLVCLLIGAPGTTWALTDEEVFRDFRFNFVNPGARALGMGGAFIAAGDDATAAQSNPAALHYVNTKEFFLEYRAVRPDTQAFAASANTLSNPDPFFLQLQSVSNGDDTNFASFASFALPFRIGARRARLSFSRQVVLNVKTNLEDSRTGQTTNLRYADPSYPPWVSTVEQCDVPAGTLEQYSICNTVTGNLDAELVHYNLGFSYSFIDDFSIGLTATYATLSMTSNVTNTTEDPRGIISTPNPRLFVGGVATPIITETKIDDRDSGTAYTLGLHWHPDKAFPSGYSPITFGLVYRRGANLSVQEALADSDPNTPPTFENTLREPDRYGFGASYRTPRHWIFAVDAERIKYSDLLKNYRSGVNFFTSSLLQTSTSIGVSNAKFTVDDATVLHAGAEFRSRVRSGWGYALRSGFYNAPDNRIRLSEVSTTDPTATASFKSAFRGGKDVNHMTGGLSLITPGGFQMQFAVDIADSGNEYLASAIYRWGKVQ